MDIRVTLNMLPDILATSALLTLAIYHFMIYWGRRKDADENYNLYFSIFVFSAALFLIAPYFQVQYFLVAYKPPYFNVINIEMFSVWCLFFSGIKFLNLLLRVPSKFKKYFYFLVISISLNFLSTFTSNILGELFYYQYILLPILLIVIINVLLIIIVNGYWIYKEKLYRNNFVLIIFFGFVLLISNMLIYRTIELLNIPKILIPNHYFTAIMLYIFAYALSVKFNKEHQELKDLKVSLERKVKERTDDLSKANQILENKNIEIENQKQEILTINEELSIRAEELKELDNVKSQFFTNISHEFRTPLTLIIGPLESLLQNPNAKEFNYEYELMLKQAKRLLTLINQLLELSKLQKSMMKLQLTSDNINIFIRTLVSAYSSFALELNVKLNFSDKLPEQEIWFDKDKLEKIVTNLITNALKFTKSNGTVDVTIQESENGDFIEIIVSDNGVGIEPEQLMHIFDPFYQAEYSTNNKLEGTGIGLALVKELTQLHHGNIHVKSIPAQGSEFIVTFPTNKAVYNEEEFQIQPLEYELNKQAILFENEEVITPSTENHKKDNTIILLVDDNADMRNFIRNSLEKEFHIIDAINGSEGFEMALKNIPDLIVADIMMPVMNGLELTRLVKSNELTSHIPVILLTAKATTNSKLEGLDTQADDYITKPFNMNELTIRIRNLIITRKKLREKYSKNIVMYPTEIVAASIDERFLQKALHIVEENLGESEFNIEMFSQRLNMSRTQVHRKLTALTGQSATEFIRSLRLKRAAQLLRQKSGSVSEIAYQTGFGNLSYFTKTFKELFGIAPSEYKG
jgi:signal transduction histidine kinase/DNA-binding response OmpR family regulator